MSIAPTCITGSGSTRSSGRPFPPGLAISRETMAAVADLAEKTGFDALWFGDHVIFPSYTGSSYPVVDKPNGTEIRARARVRSAGSDGVARGAHATHSTRFECVGRPVPKPGGDGQVLRVARRVDRRAHHHRRGRRRHGRRVRGPRRRPTRRGARSPTNTSGSCASCGHPTSRPSKASTTP